MLKRLSHKSTLSGSLLHSSGSEEARFINLKVKANRIQTEHSR